MSESELVERLRALVATWRATGVELDGQLDALPAMTACGAGTGADVLRLCANALDALLLEIREPQEARDAAPSPRAEESAK